MAATVSVKVTYSSPYRGGTKTWSNRIHLTGPSWASQTQFNTFADALTADLKTCFGSTTTITEVVGYNAGSDLPVFSKSYSLAGTHTFSGGTPAPLETCALWRFTTDQRSTKNHPIYLFQYMHAVQVDNTAGADALNTGQKSAMTGVANDFVAGYSDGTNTRQKAGPNGAVAQGALVETYVSHHDFPR